MDSEHEITRLAPLDEAYVAHADKLSELAHAVLQDFPLRPRTLRDKGETLRDALALRDLADRVVEAAIVVENERGASWSEIGAAAGITKQTANAKWATAVRAWTLINHRRASASRSATEIARNLDRWYAELDPDEKHAITAGLDSDAARTLAAAQNASRNRAMAAFLQGQLAMLKVKNTEAFNAAFAATGTEEQPAARRRWAQTHLDQAEVYDQLAAVEPNIADDHRTDAAKQRAIAAEINRDQEQTP